MRNKCLILNKEEENDKRKEKRKRIKNGKKVLQTILESGDEIELKEVLEEFCFVENDEEEEIDEELQTAFEEMYQNFINDDKVNKDLKMMIQSLSSEKRRIESQSDKP